MKTGKRTAQLVAYILSGMVFLAAVSGCSNPMGSLSDESSSSTEAASGTLVLALASSSSRQVQPSALTDSIAKYSLTLTRSGYETIKKDNLSSVDNLSLSDITPGVWTLSIIGYEASGLPIAESTVKDIEIKSGSNSVAFSFTPVANTGTTGTMSVSFTLTDAVSNDITIKLWSYPDLAEVEVSASDYTITTALGATCISINRSLTSGTYLLDVNVIINGAIYSYSGTVIRIYTGCSSAASMSFTTADLVNTASVYYVADSIKSSGNGLSAATACTFEDALGKIAANSLVSASSPAIIILVGDLTVPTTTGYRITKPVVIMSVLDTTPNTITLGSSILPSTSGSVGSFLCVGDSSNGRSGSLTLKNAVIAGVPGKTSSAYGLVQVQNGSFTMQKASLLTGNVGASQAIPGGGVYVNGDKASFVMSGGQISGCSALSGGGLSVLAGSAVIDGGSIISNMAIGVGGGIAINLANSSTLKIAETNAASPTLIAGNNAESGAGIGITGGSAGSVVLSGGTISGNTATSGGGIYCGKDSSGQQALSLGAVKISGNTAVKGGGVYVNNSVLTVSGAKITGNSSTVNGGGIYLDDNNRYGSSAVSLDTGVVSGNTAVAGAGVYAHGGTYAQKVVLASTAIVITGNIASGYGGGICLDGSSHIDASAVSGWQSVVTDNGGIVLPEVAVYKSAGSLADIVSAVSASSSSLPVYVDVLENLFVTAPIEIATGKVVALGSTNGITLTRSTAAIAPSARFVDVAAGGKLTLCGSLCLDGGSASVGSAIVTVSGGTFTLAGNAVLQNNWNSQVGGGVKVASGVFNLSGGKIQLNKASSGGGVYAVAGSTVNVNSGLITSNAAVKAGGGLYCEKSVVVNLGNGVSIDSLVANNSVDADGSDPQYLLSE